MCTAVGSAKDFRACQNQQYRAFGDDKDSERRRQASANRVFTILKAALNHAFHDGKVPSDIAWRTVKPFKASTRRGFGI
jgi:hypothetical protein